MSSDTVFYTQLYQYVWSVLFGVVVVGLVVVVSTFLSCSETVTSAEVTTSFRSLKNVLIAYTLYILHDAFDTSDLPQSS